MCEIKKNNNFHKMKTKILNFKLENENKSFNFISKRNENFKSENETMKTKTKLKNVPNTLKRNSKSAKMTKT